MSPPHAAPLAAQTILVCGAHGGLGAAVTLAAARAGAQVILLGRRIPRLHKLYDDLVAEGAREPAIYPLDLAGATPDDHAALARTIERECGRLDAIVHAAVEFKGLASLENMPLEDWFTGMHVNLTAPWLMTRACLPLLRQRERACVLFLLDEAERSAQAFWGPYAIAKQALRSLISVWREELENSPVRLLGALPGPMRTQLRARAWFAEDPGSVPPPQAYAGAVVDLLAGAHAELGPIVKLEPRPEATPRPLGLASFDS